uniref:Ribosomal protein S2 n=1 Tax=Ulva sp. TM708 TaxID=2496873 RepID=A0A7R6NFE3_9CHLO|nr:ribosomal protein S2 [Ulva sp. TM708]AZP40119.1 ribosomal protein S2 [Ulva sp. TM708]
MIFIINNNTTHNYSTYSTGPSRIYSASLNVKCPIQTMINHYAATFQNNQNNKPYLFQTKQLLCWGPDIAFFNLRNTFSNIFKALQICWSAARNNKKILFINGKDSIAADSILVNAWLMQQYKRHSMPRKLNNISNYGSKYTSHSPASSKYSINTAYQNKALFNHLSTFLNSCCIKMQMPHIPNTKVQSFIKNSNSLFNCILTKSKDFYAHNCSQLRHMQSNNSKYAHQQKTKQNELPKTRKLNIQKASKIIHSDMLGLGKSLTQNENKLAVSNYDQLKINTNNAIRLQVKEAHILTQQITGEITVPLVGFLTNTRTGFNTLQNQLNDEFFNQSKSVYLNNSLNTLVKNVVHIRPKTKSLNRQSALHHNYEASINKLQSSYSTSIYHQYYLPFSFYVRPVNLNNGGLLINQQSIQKQYIVRQNVFGKILAWRLKGQYPSSMFYSQYKIFDQRHKYKSKQLTIANNNNVDAGVYALKLTPAKSQVLFKNSKNFITLKQPVRLVQRTYKTSLKFYSNFKPYNTHSENKSPIKFSPAPAPAGIYPGPGLKPGLAFSKNTRNPNPKVLLKSLKDNSINNFYISRFYQNIKNSSMYKNQHKNSLNSTKSSVTQLFRTNYVLKAYKAHTKQLIPKQLRYDEKKFCNYYDTLINSNQLNQYQMFAKSPYVNNKLADIIFFINPEKNQNLVNQANCLKIPTIGVISGMAYSELGRRSCNHYNLNNLVNYPILGNPSSHFFVYTLIGVFVKALSSS